MTDSEEVAYLQGHRAAWLSVFRTAFMARPADTDSPPVLPGC